MRIILLLFFLIFIPLKSFAIEIATRITDREIVERLTRLEAGLSAVNKRIDDVNKRIDEGLKAVNQRIDEQGKRIDALHSYDYHSYWYYNNNFWNCRLIWIYYVG